MKKQNFVKEAMSSTVKDLIKRKNDILVEIIKTRIDINFNRSKKTSQINLFRKNIARINTSINSKILFASKESDGK